MNNYILLEDYGKYRQPVGSVIDHDGKRIFYRNINDKHIFKKGNYKALFVDDNVISFLSENEKIDLIVFDHKENGTYSVPFSLYQQAGKKLMAGRYQRGISLPAFSTSDTNLSLQRPTQTVVVKAGDE